jgi:3-deoxy-D-manno-octulosonic-acid transferase
MLRIYSFLLTIGFILMSPLFLLRRKKYASGFWQRLGYLPDFDAEEKPVVWLHCVSVGETQAARPLVTAILENYPEYKLVVSNTTRTGHDLAVEVFKHQASLVFYFPFDWKFSVRRALRKIKPDVVLLMETEIWFNFIRETAKTGAKIAIINGRLSEKSAKRYKIIQKTLRRVLRSIDLVLMQTGADAQRLLTVGGRNTRIRITGNIKFDQSYDETESELTKSFRERFTISKDAPLIIAASTHSPEEKLILESFNKVWKNSTGKLPRLMLVPRHPERFEEVAQAIKSTGFSWVKRSENASARDASAEIILLDSIGELRSVYPLAEIVFVGGSLIPHGGQSVLEPAIEGKAIVTGFYTMNFKAIVEEFNRQNALVQLEKLSHKVVPEKLAEVFSELLRNERKRTELAENARRVIQESRGATARTVESLKPLFREKNIGGNSQN